jgi:hypothetical protein
MQAWPQMPGAGGQGYGQPNFGPAGGDMYGGGQGGGQQGGGQFGGGQFGGGQMYSGHNSGGGAGYSGGGGAGYNGGARAQDNNSNKRKYPCDNCGQMGHWKFQNVCPNYHMHLEQLAAKSATARAAQQQGGSAGGFQQPTGSTLALPPPPPGSYFNNYSIRLCGGILEYALRFILIRTVVQKLAHIYQGISLQFPVIFRRHFYGRFCFNGSGNTHSSKSKISGTL